MKTLVTLLALICNTPLVAQNVGIGTTEPLNKLQIVGNILVNSPTTSTLASPTVAQTQTMSNGGTISFLATDSVGRIFDPGGPAGNYIDNLNAVAVLPQSVGALGYEIILEDVELLTGDSLIIVDAFNTSIIYLAGGNGYTTIGKFFINAQSLRVTFKSNGNGTNGRGFNLLFRRLYDNTANAQPLSGAMGNSFFFDTKNGALRAGRLASGPIGYGSVGVGSSAKASGDYSFASGYDSKATGGFSTAMGIFSTASGDRSFAIGSSNIASGAESVAMGINNSASGNGSFAIGIGGIASGESATVLGVNTMASGNRSIAMGNNSTASGHNSIALGSYVSTSGYDGAFAVGDNSTTSVMPSFVANGFRARFVGGYRLFTTSYTTGGFAIGALLNTNQSSWSAISDFRRKENFKDVDGESFLKKIAGLHLTTWNYRGQDVTTLRHYGPMAQDFFAAFGRDDLGEIGDDTTINQQDFLGVNLIAIQALEKRTVELGKRLEKAFELINLQLKEIELLKEQNKKLSVKDRQE